MVLGGGILLIIGLFAFAWYSDAGFTSGVVSVDLLATSARSAGSNAILMLAFWPLDRSSR